MWASLTLYVAPLLYRFRLADGLEGSRVALSLLPLPVVFPSIFLPRVIADREREHVSRHALYAFSFTLSAATSVRWSVVADRFDEEWALPLVLYLAVGAASLWWFVLSHVLENGPLRTLYTHQGDVAVLPLTLVAIGTFVRDVPDEAFQAFRSVIFYVPVIVAWATLHFVAFNGFATSRTTTHEMRGFGALALSGQLIGAAHLALIELRADPEAFLFFPLVAAFLCQLTPRPTEAPVLRAWRVPGMLVLAVGTAAPLGLLFEGRFGPAAPWAFAAAAGALAVAVPAVVGNAWPLPSALYATLLTAAFFGVDADADDVRVADVLAIAGAFYVSARATHAVASPEERQRCPPCSAPTSAAATPQASRRLSLACLMRPLGRVPVCHRRRHGRALVDHMMSLQRDTCPREFAGVWWMRGNSFPMQLTCVHCHRWRREGETYRTAFWLNEGTTRSATLSGLLNRAGQSLCTMEVEWTRGQPWVRTPGWLAGRVLADTYWLYMVSEDEMVRLVADDRGTIVWQYRMQRIVRGDRTRTAHYATFMALHEGEPTLFG